MKETEFEIDKEALQALSGAAARFCDAFTEAVHRVAEVLADLFNALGGALHDVLPMLEEIERQRLIAIEKIDRRNAERSKWRRMNPPVIRTLMLDKRSKAHRCRNAI